MISCSEAVQRLWDYLENDVEAAQRDRVEEHLAFCRRCCGELEFAEQLRRVLTEAADTGLPHDVAARLSGVLDSLATIDEDDVGLADRPGGGPPTPDDPGGRPWPVT